MYTSTILVYGRYVLSSVIQVALGFLLDFPVALEVVLLHLGQTQRAPLWLEVFEVWLAALSFIISFSSSNLHFLHTGLSQIFNSIDPHLHRADCNRCLIDGLNGSNDNLFFRHINLLWRWPNIFFYGLIHRSGPLLDIFVHKSVKRRLWLHLFARNLNLIGPPSSNLCVLWLEGAWGSLIHLNKVDLRNQSYYFLLSSSNILFLHDNTFLQ